MRLLAHRATFCLAALAVVACGTSVDLGPGIQSEAPVDKGGATEIPSSPSGDTPPNNDSNPGDDELPIGQACGPTESCAQDEYCAYPPGCLGGVGSCKKAQGQCSSECPGICGCDGQLYCNMCSAQGNGIDASDYGECLDCKGLLSFVSNSVQQRCVAVMRFGYEDLSPKALAFACDPISNMTTVDHAKVLAEKFAGLPPSAQWIEEGGATPADAFVFWEPATPVGSVAVVTVHGLVAFGGSTRAPLPGNMDLGKVLAPQSWLPSDPLALNCGSSPQTRPIARGFDLRDGSPLPASVVEKLSDHAWKTPLSQGEITEYEPMLILLYPRRVAPFDPTTAEWVVLFSFKTHAQPG